MRRDTTAETGGSACSVSALLEKPFDFAEPEVRSETEDGRGPETDELAPLFVAADVVEIQRQGDGRDRRQSSGTHAAAALVLRYRVCRLVVCGTHMQT